MRRAYLDFLEFDRGGGPTGRSARARLNPPFVVRIQRGFSGFAPRPTFVSAAVRWPAGAMPESVQRERRLPRHNLR